jgi:homoserine kinase
VSPRETLRVRAPATTANLGPGFDVAAAALDLWNELEVGEGDDADPEHLAVQAFARLAPVEGLSFRFTDRIPRARGLGSSAAVIALGLLAGALAAGRDPDPEELLAVGLELEGQPDNLAAALAGGVVLTWDGRIERIATRMPATPIAVVPAAEVETRAARAALPDSVSHADAAYSGGRAAVLGAALASGSAELFAAAAEGDRLHEPYRAANAPLLRLVREPLPQGAVAITLSGSGPTVIVWALPEAAQRCAEELLARFPDTDVLALAISPTGAAPL